MYISGISFSKVKKIKEYLESSEKITGVYQRQFRDKKVELDVNIEGTVDDIAELLEKCGVDITGMSANIVEGRI